MWKGIAMNKKTPYYVIHKKELNDLLCKLKSALSENWDNFIIGYSYKTNARPWLIDYYNKAGCFAEVVSEHEYSLGKAIHVSPAQFIYNGPIKTEASFTEALMNGAYVNLDSNQELEWLAVLPRDRKYHIGLRVNYDIEKVCPGQSSGGRDGGRFGFCYENGELCAAIERIREFGLKVDGLHLHISSKTRSLDIYRASAMKACEIAEKYNLDLRFIDIGGGFFGGLANKPQFADYINLIAGELKKHFSVERTTLIVEPGMALIGSPISYVTSVIDVKDTTYGRFVITDGSRTQIDPLMSKHSYFYELNITDSRNNYCKQIISGYTCMEPDRLFTVEDAPEMKVGDTIVYNKVGAYTMCLTPLFIKYFPAVYVVDENGYKLVRREWGANDYMQGSILEGDLE